jgi:hypothetical protein
VREYLPNGIHITSDTTYLAAIAAEITDHARSMTREPSELFTALLMADASTA